MYKVLTVAGSDCSGGAGIQADIKTAAAHGIYAMSVITALTAQNTTGVSGILNAGAEFTALQIDCVFEDIRPDAVKTGMLPDKETIETVAERLKRYRAENIVVDPVMRATSGRDLMADGSARALIDRLFPLASVITPNIPEAERLTGTEIRSRRDMALAARRLSEYTAGGVLIKGGHMMDAADDLLCLNGDEIWFTAPRVDNPNTHGTGCTLSSAIACNLALGYGIREAIGKAKEYITGAVCARLDLGRGSGPLNHMWSIKF